MGVGRLGLTERQWQAASLTARGLSVYEVGLELGIEPRTVKYLLGEARAKLGVARSSQIGPLLRERGLL